MVNFINQVQSFKSQVSITRIVSLTMQPCICKQYQWL